MTNLLIVLTLPEPVRNQYYNRLRTVFPEVTVNLVDHYSKVGPHIGAADVLVTFGPMMHDDVLKAAKNLKWVQALGTGVDGIADQPSLRKEVLVTKMHGFHGAPVAEAAILMMLALSRGLPRTLRNQAEGRWERFPAKTLKDKTVGIFGVGVIAEALAPLCKSFGMTVAGISSVPRAVAGFDRMHGRDDLHRVVGDLDFLVLLTPHTPATRGIVDAKVLAAMKPSSFLVNLARGGVVDEDALIAALREGRIAGAALDVFAAEPLPRDHPFWGMPNVIVTPHLGGFFEGYPGYALPVVEENLRRFLTGDVKSMLNIVEH
jgi:phosphoglycerate dehydrogenase-like enzyme